MLRPPLSSGEKGAPAWRPKGCVFLIISLLQQQQHLLLLLLLLLLGQWVLQQQLTDAVAAAEKQGAPGCSSWGFLALGPPQLLKRVSCSRCAIATTAAAAATATTAAATATAIRPLHAAERNLFEAAGNNIHSLMPHEQQQQQAQQRQQQQQQEQQQGPAVSASSTLRHLLRICLLGRPNVGKSSLFNRLVWGAPRGTAVGGEGALVGPSPGTTRDALMATLRWNERSFEIVDTGGLVLEKEGGGPLAAELKDQVTFALQQAACAVLVVDGRAGILSDDEHMAELVRHLKMPVIVCVNKCENNKTAMANAQVFWKLGLGDPIPCSAITGTGVAELLDSRLQLHAAARSCMHAHAVACMRMHARAVACMRLPACRPNAGKSRLMNCLLNAQRSLVSPEPGTTRDAVDEFILRGDSLYCLVDTAGLRRASFLRKTSELEKHMAIRAKNAASRADVCLLVIDGSAAISKQDIRLAEMLQAQGRASIVVINKWDVALQTEELNHKEAVDYVRKTLHPLAWAEVLFVSAETGQNVAKIWQAVDAAVQQHRRRLTTALLNFVLRDALAVFPPPLTKDGKRGKIYLAQQVSTQPPTIVLFCNKGEFFPEAYRRYLEFSVRNAFSVGSTPIR
ncbi:hypothetical protein Esti_003914 [Eimeria stiedai]